MIKISKHLGGHGNTTHIDVGSLMYLKNTFNIKTMLDVGCGPGGMVDLANNMDIKSVGIDGDINQKQNNIIIHDFTTGKFPFDLEFDLGWSVEFVEHVAPQFIENFMDAFCHCKYVCMTHALPGKGGYHHVNCQSNEYWIDIFQKYNLLFNSLISQEIRKKSTMKREFMRNTGMFFENKKYDTK